MVYVQPLHGVYICGGEVGSTPLDCKGLSPSEDKREPLYREIQVALDLAGHMSTEGPRATRPALPACLPFYPLKPSLLPTLALPLASPVPTLTAVSPC